MGTRGVRGATTVAADDAGQIVARTEELLSRMVSENRIEPGDVASAVFTVTEDLDGEFPAVAVRALGGWGEVPLLCAREIPVPGSLGRCVRILLHWNTDRPAAEVRHVFLRGARELRPQWAQRVEGDDGEQPPPAGEQPVSRIAVAGLGLIGGSLALATEARGYDRDPEARRRARQRGIETADSLGSALEDADFVFLAVSTAETPALLAEAAAIRPGALISDCASLKVPVVRAAATLPAGARFVGGHPMAGSRTRGLAGADAALFHDRPWALVPTARTDERALALLGDVVTALGAVPVVLDADTHDAAMTRVSHLPHAVSAALAAAAARSAQPGVSRLAGPGLLDTTRLAEAPVGLLLELALADPQGLANAIGDVAAELTSLRAALMAGDVSAVREFFARAAAARKRLTPR